MQVLLSLGVSYTNELDQRRALSYLHTWLANHAKHGPQIAGMQHPDDTSQKLSWVVGLFEQAAAAAPADADVQVWPALVGTIIRNTLLLYAVCVGYSARRGCLTFTFCALLVSQKIGQPSIILGFSFN